MLKIMVVDDDYSVRDGMIRAINWTRMGCRVTASAGDGVEALKLIEKDAPDIIFTDVVMPNLDGIGLMEAVCKRFPQIFVVVLSAYDEAPLVRSSMRWDAVEYMIKPYDEEQVARVIEKIRSKRSSPLRHAQDNLRDEDYALIRALSEQALESLKLADPDLAEQSVCVLFDQIDALHIRSMLFITSTCVDLLTKGVEVVKQAIADKSSLEIRLILDRIAEVRTVQEMRELTLRSLRGMACTIAEQKTEMSRIVLRATRMVQQEYMANLTIQQMAERLHVSVNYLQSQFKKEVGSTIRQYMTDVRIEQAKRLLIQSACKVADVAGQVGYRDTDYFVRVFREATGLTPNEYRRSGM